MKGITLLGRENEMSIANVSRKKLSRSSNCMRYNFNITNQIEQIVGSNFEIHNTLFQFELEVKTKGKI